MEDNTNELVRQLDISITKDIEDLGNSEKKTEHIKMSIANKLKVLKDLVAKLEKMQ